MIKIPDEMNEFKEKNHKIKIKKLPVKIASIKDANGQSKDTYNGKIEAGHRNKYVFFGIIDPKDEDYKVVFCEDFYMFKKEVNIVSADGRPSIEEVEDEIRKEKKYPMAWKLENEERKKKGKLKSEVKPEDMDYEKVFDDDGDEDSIVPIVGKNELSEDALKLKNLVKKNTFGYDKDENDEDENVTKPSNKRPRTEESTPNPPRKRKKRTISLKDGSTLSEDDLEERIRKMIKEKGQVKLKGLWKKFKHVTEADGGTKLLRDILTTHFETFSPDTHTQYLKLKSV